ncbi:putative integral membrane protein linked to a cation pump [Jannaschia seosinensis]|uniref:Putative integral membrane protein linked to a cation pump n=1 Tax=Jannaschia seosinensis TaxID=313367 RepID=A0A0M7B5D5_9RHOB|nr:FixH family protein [Jannaschia seosinensis]CUH12784.1 putative integral membrane protein linked to a cation pump [Jannaschia seosinensis]
MSGLEMRADRTLKGGHVLAMFVGGFGVIITVNLILAVNAVRTFPGLETESSYVASQSFNVDRAAQDALGWDVALRHTDGRLELAVTGADDRPVRPEIVAATLGRATHVAADSEPAFAWTGTAFAAPATLAPGNWNLRIELLADDGTTFRRRIPLRVAQ